MATNIKRLLLAVILVIVAFIVIFQFVGVSSPVLTDAANSITDANNCSTNDPIPHIYNITDKYCYNGTGTDGERMYVAGQIDLPLNGLFSANGVVFLVMMAVILLITIFLALREVKGKN